MPENDESDWKVVIPENVWFDLLAQELAVLDLVTLAERLRPLTVILEETDGLPPEVFQVLTVNPPCLGVVAERLMALYLPIRTRPWWRWVWPWARDRCELHITWLTVLPHRTDSDSASARRA